MEDDIVYEIWSSAERPPISPPAIVAVQAGSKIGLDNTVEGEHVARGGEYDFTNGGNSREGSLVRNESVGGREREMGSG